MYSGQRGNLLEIDYVPGNESLLFDRDDEIRPARQKVPSGPKFPEKFAGFRNRDGLKHFERLRTLHLQAFYSTYRTIFSALSSLRVRASSQRVNLECV